MQLMARKVEEAEVVKLQKEVRESLKIKRQIIDEMFASEIVERGLESKIDTFKDRLDLLARNILDHV